MMKAPFTFGHCYSVLKGKAKWTNKSLEWTAQGKSQEELAEGDGLTGEELERPKLGRKNSKKKRGEIEADKTHERLDSFLSTM